MKRKVKVKPKLIKSIIVWFRYLHSLAGFAVNIRILAISYKILLSFLSRDLKWIWELHHGGLFSLVVIVP